MPSEILIAGFPLPEKYGHRDLRPPSGTEPGLAGYLGKAEEASEKHRAMLARGINQVAEQAFTPRTTYSALSASTATGAPAVWVALPGLDQNITVPVRAQMICHLWLRVSYTTPVAGAFYQARLLANGAEITRGGRYVWVPQVVGAGTLCSVLQASMDLEPDTLYAVTAEHIASAAAGVFTAVHLAGTIVQTHLLIRVEPRPFNADT